ncbi:carbonic anhydrase [Pelagirhabdus alkalitolerans]|uniref:carbonic anhydrase n=1 Tax=Pelagirhabdus alkalitolerans TaxID=1612202 RepID=A0A1G6N6A0_9BACI|nr:carbonic anhydrase [Pelagirhabdus alkalitolerans]SDC63373.1 carbonic anhydrase [Pelagirhabdus alkalitolerans]
MLLDDVLKHNEKFVETKAYKDYETDGIPDKHAVILTCMDTRLTELLPKAMNFKNGDVKILKTAGAIIKNPYGSVMRSILVAVHALQADEVYVVGHHHCGMSNLDTEKLFDTMKENGVKQEAFDNLEVDAHDWFKGFEEIEDSVKSSVDLIENHPLLPNKVPVHGLVIDPRTGKLDLVQNGY